MFNLTLRVQVQFVRHLFLPNLMHNKMIHLLFRGLRELLCWVSDALASLQSILGTLQQCSVEEHFSNNYNNKRTVQFCFVTL